MQNETYIFVQQRDLSFDSYFNPLFP